MKRDFWQFWSYSPLCTRSSIKFWIPFHLSSHPLDLHTNSLELCISEHESTNPCHNCSLEVMFVSVLAFHLFWHDITHPIIMDCRKLKIMNMGWDGHQWHQISQSLSRISLTETCTQTDGQKTDMISPVCTRIAETVKGMHN